MPTTNPRQGATRAGAITTLATLALAAAAHAGPQQFTRWSAPVSGSFLDPANWDTGALPTSAMPALIDAVGTPYTVNFTTAARMFPLLLDSDDATVLFSVIESINAPLSDAHITVRRGELRLASGSRGRDLSPITIEQNARFSVEASPVNTLRSARLGRDLTLNGTGRIEGRAMLVFAPDSVMNGFPTPRVNIGETGALTLQGQNVLFGGVITNRGTIHVANDPSINPSPGQNFVGALIGENSTTTNPDFQTVFNNHGLVSIARSNLTLDSAGTHTGEFQIAEGARLTLASAQTFLPGSRITGPGLTRAVRGELIISPVNIESDLEITQGGVFAGALTIGGSLIFAQAPRTDAVFMAPVTVGETLIARRRDLTFHGQFDGAFAPNSTGGEPNNAVFHASAIIRGNMAAFERATFHADALIQGDARNVTLNRGGRINGNLRASNELRGTVVVDGDFTQIVGDTSLFERNLSNDAIYFGGSVDIRSAAFEARLPIFSESSFRATAGIYDSVTADTIAFDGVGGVGGGTVRLRYGATIDARDQRAIIDRVEVSLTQRINPDPLRFVTFDNGFEIRYVPLTPATRSGFRLLIDADTLTNEQIRFGADSLLAGTLDIRLLGDAANLSFGDSFTLFAATPASNATLTGEFDLLFLPNLTRGLSFDVVYDANSVRLVVVPTPATAALLALAGLAATRRRSR
ncbi:MAG: hypothetical protein KF684_05060 [Phycisphaeraceae bacterium]|nr:hypothetical protein [Phycisphaeraceae bacterium]